jgi:hypothetical protein
MLAQFLPLLQMNNSWRRPAQPHSPSFWLSNIPICSLSQGFAPTVSSFCISCAPDGLILPPSQHEGLLQLKCPPLKEVGINLPSPRLCHEIPFSSFWNSSTRPPSFGCVLGNGCVGNVFGYDSDMLRVYSRWDQSKSLTGTDVGR